MQVRSQILGSGDCHEPIFSSKNITHFRFESKRDCKEANRLFEYFSIQTISEAIFDIRAVCGGALSCWDTNLSPKGNISGLKSWAKFFRRN